MLLLLEFGLEGDGWQDEAGVLGVNIGLGEDKRM